MKISQESSVKQIGQNFCNASYIIFQKNQQVVEESVETWQCCQKIMNTSEAVSIKPSEAVSY